MAEPLYETDLLTDRWLSESDIPDGDKIKSRPPSVIQTEYEVRLWVDRGGEVIYLFENPSCPTPGMNYCHALIKPGVGQGSSHRHWSRFLPREEDAVVVGHRISIVPHDLRDHFDHPVDFIRSNRLYEFTCSVVTVNGLGVV
jgi:hypothetical protein